MKKALFLLTAVTLMGAGCLSTGTETKPVTRPMPPVAIEPVDDSIVVSSPERNASISSPLTVSGEAQGTWFFEASFPVKLLDGNGNQLAITPVQAEGEWMTTNMVPFSGILTFAKPTTPGGTLVLMRDNPSGLPENDKSIEIPVWFE